MDIETKVTTIAEVSREYSVTRNSIYKLVDRFQRSDFSKFTKRGKLTFVKV
ncbi:hypothetical protein LEP1GSC062_4086 [Leptospira alexanderi serovar Manhao 3 str. L 60]|uniref:Uncharacterized protein n=1 Tax=Leptospira alexanderi serovar Manhao 3 str. L 60 TaxID=1049759 RepID=V6HSN3_9LEPT|nr:hypothetical protein LEP1GSC062_4086 [Leptospira alexanderi serovar Manhao 3 str. L 60]